MTPSACSLVVGAFVDGHVSGQQLNPGAGWIFRSTDDWDPGAAVDNAPNGARAGTAVNPLIDMTLAPDDGWVATQMAFRAAGTAASPQPTQLAFSDVPTSMSVAACSGPVTVQARDAAGTPRNSATGLDVALSGGNLTLYADGACAYAKATVHIGAGTSSATAYVKSSAKGVTTLSAQPPAPVTGQTLQLVVN
jgi:hypothetical protein